MSLEWKGSVIESIVELWLWAWSRFEKTVIYIYDRAWYFILMMHSSTKELKPKFSLWFTEINEIFPAWALFQYKDCLFSIWRFQIIKMKESHHCLMFIMGIHIWVTQKPYIETPPRCHKYPTPLTHPHSTGLNPNKLWVAIHPISVTQHSEASITRKISVIDHLSRQVFFMQIEFIRKIIILLASESCLYIYINEFEIHLSMCVYK